MLVGFFVCGALLRTAVVGLVRLFPHVFFFFFFLFGGTGLTKRRGISVRRRAITLIADSLISAVGILGGRGRFVGVEMSLGGGKREGEKREQEGE